MSLYLRKSITVGPLRFNLSGSGIGVSAGVKGLRFGTGPRGNYVHMGRHGIYYRSAYHGAAEKSAGTAPQRPAQATPRAADGLAEIASGPAENMVDSSSAELLEEIRSKRHLSKRWPVALLAGLFVTPVAMAATRVVTYSADFSSLASVVVVLVVLLVCLVSVAWLTVRLARQDELRKTVVLMYEFDDHGETTYQGLQNGFDCLVGSSGAWHIDAEGAVTDRKRHAGATELVRRHWISFSRVDPPDVRTNLGVPMIPAGSRQLYFFPDRILVYDGPSVGAIGYERLVVKTEDKRMIEAGTVPRDSEQVGSTWQYVNKTGGPDRRFSSNRVLPILLYGRISLRSETGLNEVIEVSNPRAAVSFAAALKHIAEALPASVVVSQAHPD